MYIDSLDLIQFSHAAEKIVTPISVDDSMDQQQQCL
jgi:hypothetical protein